MNRSWGKFFRQVFDLEPVHPLDRGIAKKYIKQRLLVLYPHLQGNPSALEDAYRSLNMEPRRGIGKDEAPTVFEMTLPESGF